MTTLDTLIDLALTEDCPTSDVTIDCLLEHNSPITATLIAKEAGIFYGSELTKTLITRVDTHIKTQTFIQDSQAFKAGDTLFQFEGPSFSLLKLERVLLNFLQRLCGIASMSQRFVSALNDPNIHILDTRKTTPGFRELEKAAVKAGGAHNHRHHLSDMVLIKENHLTQLENEGGNLEEKLQHYKNNHPHIPILIEVETLEQVESYPLHLANIVMLDNFDIADIEKAADILKARNINIQIEVSGGIALDNIHLYQNQPIHRISTGALTHSVQALDLSLIFLQRTIQSCST